MNEIQRWFASLPIFTRYWFGLTVLFTLIGRFSDFFSYYMALLYDPFVYKFQIWRAATALFWYPLNPQTGFHFLINLYFLYSYSVRLETGEYAHCPADYLFMLLFNWACSVIVGLGMDYPMLMDPMVISVLYLWCQLNRDTIVQFWFGTQFKAMYLPWVLMLFNLIIAGGGIMELMGIMIGHLYYFMVFKYPQEFGGPVLLSTPRILTRYFPGSHRDRTDFGAPPQRPASSSQGTATTSWGQGRRLGTN